LTMPFCSASRPKSRSRWAAIGVAPVPGAAAGRPAARAAPRVGLIGLSQGEGRSAADLDRLPGRLRVLAEIETELTGRGLVGRLARPPAPAPIPAAARGLPWRTAPTRRPRPGRRWPGRRTRARARPPAGLRPHPDRHGGPGLLLRRDRTAC